MRNNSFFGLIPVLLLSASCASPTHVVDPYPSETSPEHNTEAYEARDGSISPATGADATVAAGSAAIDTALIGLGRSRADGSSSTPKEIRGHCEIEGAGAKLPCASVVVLLRDSAGRELSRTRTDGRGAFAFPAVGGQDFFVGVVSGAYAVRVEPPGPLRAGSDVRLTLSARDGQ